MNRRDIIALMGAGLVTGFTPWKASGDEPHGLVGYIRTNWSQDPYAFGSYSYIAKGASRRDLRRLEKPIADRIFFAGEAVFPRRNSTVHAAYESGQRTAKAVQKTNAERIAIIGAGMSGLSAAHALSEAGRTVKMFEARDRIGGRVWTDNRLGPPLDLGASWIHGLKNNPLTKLADGLDLPRQRTEDGYAIRGGDGREIAYEDAPDWLHDVVEVQTEAGAAAWQINEWAYLRSSDYDGHDVTFPNGYAEIFEALEGDYSIVLDALVDRIVRSSDAVEIGVRDNAAEQFDAVIVTVPLGVLKQASITFDPPLPEEKQGAIERLGMGLLDKVYLQFEDVFWDQEATWIATPENGLPQGQFNEWFNLARYTGDPILVGLNGGPPAFALADRTDDEIVSMALKTLFEAYPAVK